MLNQLLYIHPLEKNIFFKSSIPYIVATSSQVELSILSHVIWAKPLILWNLFIYLFIS